MARREIIRWDPLREVRRIWDEMDRLFSGFFERWPELGEREVGFAPAIDVSETESEVQITAEVPGIEPKDISIKVQDDTLIISGEKKREKEEKGRTYHRVERCYGRFERAIRLPSEVEADKAKASYKNGVLTITIPKSEKVKPKEIKVEIE